MPQSSATASDTQDSAAPQPTQPAAPQPDAPAQQSAPQVQ
jgi:hypothetical protein